MHNKRWQIASPLTPQAAESLAAFSPILSQILFNRGYATEAEARGFLNATPTFDSSPWQMTGIAPAVDRIVYALNHAEPIAIYGDYDVDGVTATALLVQVLRALGGDAREYIPNRFDEGYGLNPEALDVLKEQGVKLVITVDCGIRSPDEAAHARSLGLDLIISDHHHPAQGELPPAFAVINPKQPGDVYPDKDLAGVGVAYKIAEALCERLPSRCCAQPSNLQLETFLDLVALGTVADLAPLTGENRVLVRKGIQSIRATQRQGLFALANIAQLSLPRTTATNIGFVLGPRLNAAGRLDSALAAFELLTTTDVMRAGQLAQQLDVQNRERQGLTRAIQQHAEEIALREDPDALLLFAVDPDFNPGVVGLAASRLVDLYYRPAIVGQVGDEFTRCSCRSIPEFHITDALDQCTDLLVRHGGHKAAAGFTLRNENLAELKSRLKAIAAERLGAQDLRPTLTADAEISLTDLRPELLKHLSYLEPTGYGNPNARFVSRGVKVKNSRTVGAQGKHLKMIFEDERGITHDAIGFQLGHLRAAPTRCAAPTRQADLPARVDILYTFEANEYNGRTTLQLNLKDVKGTGVPD
ncbi:MAG: single-stranded-DNA-specific exonuclease RecJ [Anaerolineales bacterium]|nr:single-stranded-DNA-specific exonuclease RecJ [Anaerolineales bacterium]